MAFEICLVTLVCFSSFCLNCTKKNLATLEQNGIVHKLSLD
jgi:hypothetical protein